MTDAATLKAELASLFEEYLAGKTELYSLRAWELEHMLLIWHSGDDNLRLIAGKCTAARVIVDEGVVSEDELRDELREDLKLLRSAA